MFSAKMLSLSWLFVAVMTQKFIQMLRALYKDIVLHPTEGLNCRLFLPTFIAKTEQHCMIILFSFIFYTKVSANIVSRKQRTEDSVGVNKI